MEKKEKRTRAALRRYEKNRKRFFQALKVWEVSRGNV